jgi:hypothetical protein
MDDGREFEYRIESQLDMVVNAQERRKGLSQLLPKVTRNSSRRDVGMLVGMLGRMRHSNSVTLQRQRVPAPEGDGAALQSQRLLAP